MWCVAPLSTIHIFLEVATPQRIWVRNVPALAKVTGEEKFSLKFEGIGLFCRRASKHCHLKQRPQLRKPFCFWPLFLLHVCWSPMKFPTFITCMSTFVTMITTVIWFLPLLIPLWSSDSKSRRIINSTGNKGRLMEYLMTFFTLDSVEGILEGWKRLKTTSSSSDVFKRVITTKQEIIAAISINDLLVICNMLGTRPLKDLTEIKLLLQLH